MSKKILHTFIALAAALILPRFEILVAYPVLFPVPETIIRKRVLSA